MDEQISKLIKKLGVKVFYDDYLEDDGKYVPILDIIMINNLLDDFSKKRALLHELGHVCEDKDYYDLYKTTYALISKTEWQANNYMIRYIIDENDGYYNYSQLIEEFDLGMGYDVLFAK